MENIKHVDSNVRDDKISLSIQINRVVDNEWSKCFQKAILQSNDFVDFRMSGAPTLRNVSFSGCFAYTPFFPNDDFAKSEAKEFLKELDKAVGIADILYLDLQNKKQLELMKAEQKQMQEAKTKEELDKFFNED